MDELFSLMFSLTITVALMSVAVAVAGVIENSIRGSKYLFGVALIVIKIAVLLSILTLVTLLGMISSINPWP